MMKNYTLLFLLFSLSLKAQISVDWVTDIREEYRFGTNGPFMFDPKIAADAEGNTFNCGYAYGTGYDLLMGEEDLPVEGDALLNAYVAMTNPNGQPMWLKRFSGFHNYPYNASREGRIVAHPSEEGVLLVAMVRRGLIWGNDTLTDLGENMRLLIAHVDTEGELLTYQLLTANLNGIYDLQLASNGDLLLAGALSSFAGRLGDEIVIPTSDPAHFAARISPEGEVRWFREISGTEEDDVVLSARLRELSDGRILYLTGVWGIQSNIIGFGVPFRRIRMYFLDARGDEPLQAPFNLARLHGGQISDLQQRLNGDIYMVGEFRGDISIANQQNSEAYLETNRYDQRGFLLKMKPDGTVFDFRTLEAGFLPEQLLMFGEYYVVIGNFYESEEEEVEGGNRLEDGHVIKVFSYTDRLVRAENITTFRRLYNRRYWLQARRIGRNSLVVTAECDGSFRGEVLPHLADEFLFDVFFHAQLSIDPEALTLPAANTRATAATIYPNPNRGVFQLRLLDGYFGESPLEVLDAYGRVIYVQSALGQRSQYALDLSYLPKGAYYLRWNEEMNPVQWVKQ